MSTRIGKLAGRAVRERLGLSQEAVARRAKMDRAYLSNLESGSRNPSVDVVERLAKVELCATKLCHERLLLRSCEFGLWPCIQLSLRTEADARDSGACGVAPGALPGLYRNLTLYIHGGLMAYSRPCWLLRGWLLLTLIVVGGCDGRLLPDLSNGSGVGAAAPWTGKRWSSSERTRPSPLLSRDFPSRAVTSTPTISFPTSPPISTSWAGWLRSV